MKKEFHLNADEEIIFDEFRGKWLVKIFKSDYVDGIGRWVEVGEFSSKGRAISLIKQSR